MTDIVAERFDAGVRLGEQVAKDMIAVRIGPDLRMAVVGSPAYFYRRSMPQAPPDLTEHDCIGLRLATSGGELVWEFERNAKVLHVRVEGQLTFSNGKMMLNAALDGFGLGYVLEDQARPYIEAGRLDTRSGCVVPAVRRIPPLLCEPQAAIAGLLAGRGSLAVEG